MTITTQRTSKGPKVLIALGLLGVLAGVVGLLLGEVWWLTVLLLSGLAWSIGKITAWWMNE